MEEFLEGIANIITGCEELGSKLGRSSSKRTNFLKWKDRPN